MKDLGYEVIWPRSISVAGRARPARRLETLEGKTIGFVWNWMFRGEQVFPVIEKELSRRFRGMKFVSYHEFGPTHGYKEADVLDGLAEKLRWNRCDAVISGIGC